MTGIDAAVSKQVNEIESLKTVEDSQMIDNLKKNYIYNGEY